MDEVERLQVAHARSDLAGDEDQTAHPERVEQPKNAQR